MSKPWEPSDFRKIIRHIPDEKQIMNHLFQQEDSTYIMDTLKEYLEDDMKDLMDLLSSLYEHCDDEKLQEYKQYVLDGTVFQSEEELDHKVKHYQFFMQTIQNLNEYMTRYTIEELIDLCDQETYEDIAHYLLAKYYREKKLSKNHYFTDDEYHSMIHRYIDAYFQKDHSFFKQQLQHIQNEKQEAQENIKKRKIKKILLKANQQLSRFTCQKDISYQELTDLCQQLEERILQKLSALIDIHHLSDYPEIEDFLERCRSLPQKVEKEENDSIPASNDQEETIDIELIRQFYSQNHLYFKKSQIIQEVNEHSSILQFYEFYQQADQIEDHEEKIKMLEELISDVKESGLKKLESLRRLISVAQKMIDEIIDVEEDEEELVDETITDDLSGPTIQIGKFTVLQKSVQNNPIDLKKLSDLLAPSSQNRMHDLEYLIIQNGYDKVHNYLLKSPMLDITDLDAIIRIDRQLRFEYQRILEDIEMYFRSSLTYYLTNKYDQKYIVYGTDQYFYKRGYLMRNLFIDAEEHYEQVKLLRDRIDAEIKNRHLQITNEYQRYKYALPFSSAAGIMTFGWIMSMFDNLNDQDKHEYLRTYYRHLSSQTFSSWMNSLTNLRNRCAHYHSLYRISSLKELRPIMTKDMDSNGYDDDIKHSSLFYYTLVMTRLAPDAYNIEDFIDAVSLIFRKAGRENQAFDLQKDYSFPKNWRTILENEKNAKMNNGE